MALCCVDLPDGREVFDLVFFANADWLTNTSKSVVSRMKLIVFTVDIAVFIIHFLSYQDFQIFGNVDICPGKTTFWNVLFVVVVFSGACIRLLC